jgi:4-carboxymuconolactone decarboxylase
LDISNVSTLGGRLPLVSPSHIEADQRQLYDLLDSQFVPWANANGFKGKTETGELIGPFNALLYSSAISMGYVQLTNAESSHTSLNKRVREVVILSVGAVWKAHYELYAHSAVARTVGISGSAIDALVEGESSPDLSADELVAHRFARQLAADHNVDPELYKEAEATFGQAGLVDLVYLIGMYLFTCNLLNAFKIPAPDRPVQD